MSTSRGWLHIHSWSVFIASISLLAVGLKIWTITLNEKNNVFNAFNQTSALTIQALEERVRTPLMLQTYTIVQFNCCGFFNSTSPPFVISPNACPDEAVAATRRGCVIPLQPYADLYLDRFCRVFNPANGRLFSTLFGFVGIGTCAILSGAMLLKARTTEARYVRIAEKGIL